VTTTPFLADDLIRLEPLTLDHAPGLAQAGAVDRTTYAYTWVPNGLDQVHEYIATAAEHARGGALVYAVVLTESGRVVGSTRVWDLVRFGSPDGRPQAGEIGHTWYASDVQRTGVNTAAKFLLLTHLFDDCSFERVTLKTDARNERSRAAIERLGAQYEGTRRAHMVAADGGIRDTAYYSIVRTEWPTVQGRLARLRER
jgi:RimJ/RimL family protein N-acetyltransferase